MRKTILLSFFITLMAAACSPPNGSTATAPAASAITSTLPVETPTATPLPPTLIEREATPYTFPSPAAPLSICDGAPPSLIILHERARVTGDEPPLNLRDAAGLNGARVGRLQTNTIVMVIDGPRCADKYTWFQVRSDGIDGWVAEGESGKYYIAPYSP